jgi:RNA polymerase primary sigma factor
MLPLNEILKNPKPIKRNGFDRADTKILLKIPRSERTPALVEQLLIRHKPLAIYEAKHLWKRYMHLIGAVLEFEDVLSAAMYGLLVGINRYDYRYNTEFSTYTLSWIKQAAIREIEKNIGQARIPTHFLEKIRRSWKNMEQGIKPNEDILLVQHQLLTSTSLDSAIKEDGQLLIDFIPSEASFNIPKQLMSYRPEFTLLRNDLRRRIEESLQVLKKKRDREVIRMRFGINKNSEDHTLEEVAQCFGMTRERVRQIADKYIQNIKMKNLFDEEDFAIFRGY